MRFRMLGFAVVIGLVVAACGEVGVGGGETTEPAPDPTPREMLQIRSEGGFAPVEFTLSNGPTYTLLTNGDLIVAAPIPEIYPGPLLPNYQVIRISEAQMSDIEDAIDEIGLPGMTDEFDDSAAAFVADATTEVITLWDEDGAHRYSVYALGIGDDPMAPSETATDPRTVAFQDLYEYLGNMSTGDATPYQTDRVRVIAGPSGLDVDQELADLREWPFGDEDPSTWSRVNVDWSCKAFEAEVLTEFEDATQVTTWDLDGAEILLLVRPLMPGEPDCPV